MAGRIAPVHKTLLSASKVAGKNHDIWLTKDGGWIYPAGSDVGKKIQRLLEEESRSQRYKAMIPVYMEYGVYNIYMQMGNGAGLKPLADDARPRAPVYNFESLAKLSDNAYLEKVTKMKGAELKAFRNWSAAVSAQDSLEEKVEENVQADPDPARPRGPGACNFGVRTPSTQVREMVEEFGFEQQRQQLRRNAWRAKKVNFGESCSSGCDCPNGRRPRV